MRITLVQPCIGREPGRRHLRSWQMEPLTLANLAALTPQDVEVDLVDDRLEAVPFDAPTDLVAMTVETYTARRAYQIASDYRRRGVPVVMGGFHPTLCSDEASRHAETLAVGEAESIWPQIVDDYCHGRPQSTYVSETRPDLAGLRPDRSIFTGKRYLPIGLVEASRGCRFRCDFCAIGAYHRGTQRWRPVDEIVAAMVEAARERRLIFLVDDNIGAEPERALELFDALEGRGLRWMSQCSIHAARDEAFVERMARSGCLGVLIGFESLSPSTLRAMNKGFNASTDGHDLPLGNLARHGVAVFGTFVFGYDEDPPDAFEQAVDFARAQRLYLAAFNHLVPFPGTPLYKRLEGAERLRFDRWWLEEGYRFNDVAFRPARMTPADLRARCLDARRAFYSTGSIATRALSVPGSRLDFLMRNYLPLNLWHRADVRRRNGYPLGDQAWHGPMLLSEPRDASRPRYRVAHASI